MRLPVQIISIICLAVSFHSFSLAQEDPPSVVDIRSALTDGIEEAESETQIRHVTSPAIRAAEGDFQFMPLPDDDSDELENFGKDFMSFFKDPRNAGLLPDFLKRYPSSDLSLLLTGVLEDEAILEKFDELGMGESVFQATKVKFQEENVPLRLDRLMGYNRSVFREPEVGKFLSLVDLVREKFTTLSQTDGLRKAEFQNLDGETESQSLFEQLDDRMMYLETAGEKLQTNNDTSRFPALYIFSVFLSKDRVLAAIHAGSNGDQGEESENSGADADELSQEQRQVLIATLRSLNENVEMDWDGQKKEVRLASTMVKTNSFFEAKVQKLTEDVTQIYEPFVEERLKSSSWVQGLSVNDPVRREFETFEANAALVKSYTEAQSRTLQQIESFSQRYDLGLQPTTWTYPAKVQAAYTEMIRKGVPASEIRSLKGHLKTLTQIRMNLIDASDRANLAFQQIYREYKRANDLDRGFQDRLTQWIRSYDESHTTSYSAMLNGLYNGLKERADLSVEQLNVPLQGGTSQCLQMFYGTLLREIEFSNSAEEDKPFRLEQIDSKYTKRTYCFALYENRVRTQYESRQHQKLFGDGQSNLGFIIRDLFQSSSNVEALRDAANSSVSLYEGVLRPIEVAKSIIDVEGQKVTEWAQDSMMWARDNSVPIPRIPEGPREVKTLNYGEGVLHNLSVMGVDKRDGWNLIDVAYPETKEDMDTSHPFFGATLGLTLGDIWLVQRESSEKGSGGARELLKELKHYLQEAGAMSYFIRRNLHHKANKIRRELTEAGAYPDLPGPFTEDLQQKFDWLKRYEESDLGQARPIFPFQLKNTWLGISYAFPGEELETRPVYSQVQVPDWIHWEGAKQAQPIVPRMDYNFKHPEKEAVSGPVYQIYFPIFKLEEQAGRPRHYEVSANPFTESELRELFSSEIAKITLRYRSKTKSVTFSDGIYLNGKGILDAVSTEPNSPGLNLENESQ